MHKKFLYIVEDNFAKNAASTSKFINMNFAIIAFADHSSFTCTAMHANNAYFYLNEK